MTQLLSKHTPAIAAPAVPAPPPPVLSPTGTRPSKQTQVPSLLGLAAAGGGGGSTGDTQSKGGGKSLLGQ